MRKKKEKNFWDTEIIGNRRKIVEDWKPNSAFYTLRLLHSFYLLSSFFSALIKGSFCVTPPFPFYRCTLDLAYLLRTEKSCLYRELLDKRSEKFKLFILSTKVFTGITESRKSFSQSRQCSTDLNESFGFHLKILVSL